MNYECFPTLRVHGNVDKHFWVTRQPSQLARLHGKMGNNFRLHGNEASCFGVTEQTYLVFGGNTVKQIFCLWYTAEKNALSLY